MPQEGLQAQVDYRPRPTMHGAFRDVSELR